MKTYIPSTIRMLLLAVICIAVTSIPCLAAPTIHDLAGDPENLEIQGDAANQEIGSTGTGITSTLATGDINGDGIGDLIVASEKYGLYGAVHILFGSASLPASPAMLSDLADVSITGSINQGLANALAIGDVNGDGVGDLVIGSTRLSEPGLSACGKVLIYFGRTTWPSTLDIADADVALAGEKTNGLFAETLCLADANGDGIKDLLVTAPYHNVTTMVSGVETTYDSYGKVYLFLGRGAWSASPSLATADTVFLGPEAAGLVGTRLWAGDCNGDGREEIFIGSFKIRPTGYTSTTGSKKYGVVWGLLGRATSSLPATVRLKDYPSTTLHAEVDFFVHGNNTYYGIGYRGACGDINGDGLADLIIGASPSFSHLYVYFGHTGFAASGPVLPASIDLNLDRYLGGGSASSPTSLQHVLSSIAVGDFDGDGLQDILTGFGTAMLPDRNQGGLVALRYGRSWWPLTAEDDDVNWHGGAASDGAGSMVAVGDITGDGRAELIFNAPGADRSGANNCGKIYIIAGTYSSPELSLSLDAGVVTVNAASRSGRTLLLESSEKMMTWDPVTTWNTDGSMKSVSEALSGPKKFYRLKINPAP